MMVGRWLHVIFIQCIAGYQRLSIHSWTGSPYWSTIGFVRVIGRHDGIVISPISGCLIDVLITRNPLHDGGMTRHPYYNVLTIVNSYNFAHTSSTAQGGGGSFKNRKPIGKGWLLWITDGRAKPLMDRKVIDVSSLSLSFSDYLPTYLCIYLSICLSVCLSIYVSIYLSIHLPIYLSICLSVCLSLSLSLSLFHLSICLSV